jgi:hypothetical protein
MYSSPFRVERRDSWHKASYVNSVLLAAEFIPPAAPIVVTATKSIVALFDHSYIHSTYCLPNVDAESYSVSSYACSPRLNELKYKANAYDQEFYISNMSIRIIPISLSTYCLALE